MSRPLTRHDLGHTPDDGNLYGGVVRAGLVLGDVTARPCERE